MDIAEVNDTQAVIKPDTDILASSAQEFKSAIKAVIDQGVNTITMDLSRVNAMDSIGVGLLVAVHNSLASKGGKLSVENVSADIYDLLTVMRLDQHFPIKKA